MADITYPLFPIFAFLGFLSVLIPLPWHLEAWNSATCFYMMWAALACLNQFVNSVVWTGNALNPAPIWCDISTRIIMGASVGIPASSMCIMRRLHSISRIQAVTISRADKRRAILIDAVFCVLVPIMCMVFAYVVQGHRFDIFEDIGCYPVIYNTALAYVLVYMWPIAFGLASAIYCGLSIHAFAKRRAQLSEFLSSNPSLTASRYVRLMGLAMTDMLLTVPLAIYVVVLNATTSSVEPWVSWADTHFDFSRVDQIPAVIWHIDHQLVVSLELSRWLTPVCALLFFAFFGFASEARKNYANVYWRVAGLFGFKRPSASAPTSSFRRFGIKASVVSSHGSLPVYVKPPKPAPLSSFGTETEKTFYSAQSIAKPSFTNLPSTPSSPSYSISDHSTVSPHYPAFHPSESTLNIAPLPRAM